jgi:hypothetical protein
MCGDKALRSLFTGDNSGDIYKQMASLIRNKPVEQVTADERAQFKQVTLVCILCICDNTMNLQILTTLVTLWYM